MVFVEIGSHCVTEASLRLGWNAPPHTAFVLTVKSEMDRVILIRHLYCRFSLRRTFIFFSMKLFLVKDQMHLLRVTDPLDK